MRAVPLVQVAGPPGGGKTTLIERLLRSHRSRLLAAVRVVSDDGVQEPTLDPQGDAETARYAAAGAYLSQRVRLPIGGFSDVLDALEACEERIYAADAIVIEGGPTVRRDVDALVFVTPPLEPGAGLTTVVEREVGRMDGNEALRLMLGLNPVLSEEERAELEALEALEEGEYEEEVIEEIEIPDEVGDRIMEWLEHGYPLIQKMTELVPGYEALAEAQVAVVWGGADEEAAQGTLAAIRGLRKDEELVRSLRRYYAQVGPRSLFAADLRDPRDAGTRRVIEAIKRRMRAAER